MLNQPIDADAHQVRTRKALVGRKRSKLLELRTLRHRQCELKTCDVGHAQMRRQFDVRGNALCCDARGGKTARDCDTTALPIFTSPSVGFNRCALLFGNTKHQDK